MRHTRLTREGASNNLSPWLCQEEIDQWICGREGGRYNATSVISVVATAFAAAN